MERTYRGYYQSPIGLIEITGTESAITGTKFADQRVSEEMCPVIEQCVSQLDEYFKGNRKKFDLPLDPAGTEFQRKVWKALTDIPYGETRNYQEIAGIVNRGKACRAVGGANNRNPIFLLIPCHRVIGKNGGLTGYAGGLDRKEWLLRHESGNKA